MCGIEMHAEKQPDEMQKTICNDCLADVMVTAVCPDHEEKGELWDKWIEAGYSIVVFTPDRAVEVSDTLDGAPVLAFNPDDYGEGELDDDIPF
jgi:hypothetical protein